MEILSDPKARVVRTAHDHKSTPFVVGIDEAGRGPVVGPMVYAAFATTEKSVPFLKDLGVNDSKKLSPVKRESIFAHIINNEEFYREIDVISPSEISRAISSHRQNVSLNSISHDSAVNLIKRILRKHVVIKTVYLDTVGDADKYQKKLEKLFPGIEIVVTSKADSKYICVGAASILAKVTRDRHVKEIESKYREPIGSGYPSDPQTVRFIKTIIHPFYGFPEGDIRLRWKTCENLLASTPGVLKIDFDEPQIAKKPFVPNKFGKRARASNAQRKK